MIACGLANRSHSGKITKHKGIRAISKELEPGTWLQVAQKTRELVSANDRRALERAIRNLRKGHRFPEVGRISYAAAYEEDFDNPQLWVFQNSPSVDIVFLVDSIFRMTESIVQ